MVGDRVFRVNSEYAGGLPFNVLQSKLKTSDRPLEITFIRVNNFANDVRDAPEFYDIISLLV